MGHEIEFVNHSRSKLVVTPHGDEGVDLVPVKGKLSFRKSNSYMLTIKENNDSETNYALFKYVGNCYVSVEIPEHPTPGQPKVCIVNGFTEEDITVSYASGTEQDTISPTGRIHYLKGDSYKVENKDVTELVNVNFEFSLSLEVTVSESGHPPTPPKSIMTVANDTLQPFTIHGSHLSITPGGLYEFKDNVECTLDQEGISLPLRFWTGAVDVFVAISNPFHDAKITIRNSYSKTIYVDGSSSIEKNEAIAYRTGKNYRLSLAEVEPFLDVTFKPSFSIWVNIAESGHHSHPIPPPPRKPRITILNEWRTDLDVTPYGLVDRGILDIGRSASLAPKVYTLAGEMEKETLGIDYSGIFDVFAVVEDTSVPTIKIESNCSKDKSTIKVKRDEDRAVNVSKEQPFSSGTAGNYAVTSNSSPFFAIKFPAQPYSIGFNILDDAVPPPPPPPPPPPSGVLVITNGADNRSTLTISADKGFYRSLYPGYDSGPLPQHRTYTLKSPDTVCRFEFFGSFGVNLLVHKMAHFHLSITNKSSQSITVNKMTVITKGGAPYVTDSQGNFDLTATDGNHERIAVLSECGLYPIDIIVTD